MFGSMCVSTIYKDPFFRAGLNTVCVDFSFANYSRDIIYDNCTGIMSADYLFEIHLAHIRLYLAIRG